MSDTLDPLEPSPYKTLNVPKDATLPTIRSAHRKLVLSCHPDKVQDESAKKAKAEQFHLVQQAYEILNDENRRRRWDERAKLAELKAEMMEERPPPRKAQEYGSPRAGQAPIFEMRGGRTYEEIRPKHIYRTFEEDAFSSAFAAESRSSRKYESERYGDLPSRRTSGRRPEERRTSREADTLREKRAREHEAIARDRDLKNRKRDKDRKRDKEAKFEGKNRAYVESDSSGSETDERHRSSKADRRFKRDDDDRRRFRDEPPRRGGKQDLRDYDDELDGKIYRVQDYMRKSNENIEPERRPARRRADSYREKPPQPPSPPPPAADNVRRSSGDDGRRSSVRTRGSRAPSPVRKSSGKEKRMPEIVDPPSTSRKTTMQSASSDPRNLRNMTSSSSKSKAERGEAIPRAQTFSASPKFDHPGMRRAETMPIHQMRREPPQRHSTLNKSTAPGYSSTSESSDSSDSDATPLVKTARPSPPRHSTRYKVQQDLSDEYPSPRTIYVEPDSRIRDPSPKRNPRRTTERPPMAARTSLNTRDSPVRSTAYASPPTSADDRPSPRHAFLRTDSSRNTPPLKTNGSARGSGNLFGEVPLEEHSPKSYHGGLPKTTHDHDRYGSGKGYSRRGSEDVMDRDAYPGSLHKGHRRPHDRGVAV